MGFLAMRQFIISFLILLLLSANCLSATLLYKEDFADLMRICIEVEKVPDNFAIFYAVSNVKGRVHALDNFLGWTPNFPKK